MSIPSVASSPIAAQGLRPAPFLGRVDLLDDFGAVASSWEIPLGRFSIGSAPECTIRILDGSLDPLHLILTLGKKYTLLKAVGATRISSRPIREWLIDQSTLVDLGGRSFVIHPNASRPISVVTSDRLTEIASRLAAYGSPLPQDSAEIVPDCASSLPPNNPVDLIESSKALTEIRKEVEELTETIERIKDQISSIPSIDSMLQQFHDAAVDLARVASEDRLQELSEPWLERIRDQLSQARVERTSAINQFEQSFDERLRSLDQRLQDSDERRQLNIDRIASHLESLVREHEALRDQIGKLGDLHQAVLEHQAIIDAPRFLQQDEDPSLMNPLESSSPIATDDRPEPSNVVDAIHPVSDLAAPEFLDDPREVTHDDEEEVAFDDESALGDEFSLPVDNDSISLRLQRMLSEGSERHSSYPREDSLEDRSKHTEGATSEPASDSFPIVRNMDPASIYTSLPECSPSEEPSSTVLPTFDEHDGEHNVGEFITESLVVAESPIGETAARETVVDETIHDLYASRSSYLSEYLNSEAAADPSEQNWNRPTSDREFTKSEPLVSERTIAESYLEEADSFSEISSDVDPDSNVDTSLEGAHSAASEPESVSDNEEDSIEQYMQRLLQRVRTGSSDSHAAIAKPDESPAATPRAGDLKERNPIGVPLSTNAPSAVTRIRATPNPSGASQARTAQEAKSDLELLREIANSNARRAINRSVLRRKNSDLMVKVIVVLISLTCSTAMFLMNGFRVNATLFGTIAALVVAVLWGVDSFKEYQSILTERKLRSESDATTTEVI